MEERYTIEIKKLKAHVAEFGYLPVLLRWQGYDDRNRPERVILAREVPEPGYYGEPRYLPSYAEAELVARRHEHGLGEDVRSARWDAVAGDWADVEEDRGSSGRGGREDFHSDG